MILKVIELLITSRQLGYKNINSKSIKNLSHISYTRDKRHLPLRTTSASSHGPHTAEAGKPTYADMAS